MPVSAVRSVPARTGAAEREKRRLARRAGERDPDTAGKAAQESTAAGSKPDHAEVAIPFEPFEQPLPVAPVEPEGEGRPGWANPGNAPFVTQVLAQEVLKSGLHIEPWREAISAYERAGATTNPSQGPG
ncbi:hypothetical protein N825_10375 [Skermanella stibiiresistens SB22]|uniref:Uncharacterized protein n=1 Tax=Skermanella stibiiresistens SB22 TaxID=1385369 RepID=W9H2M0_9PROT|nr:hypothetical protein N825_10375 [Skermanella stibiiresistens SB22]